MTDNETEPHTEEVDTAPEGADPDVQSDPAEGDTAGDWTSEGGATQEGPATDDEE